MNEDRAMIKSDFNNSPEMKRLANEVGLKQLLLHGYGAHIDEDGKIKITQFQYLKGDRIDISEAEGTN